MEWLVSLISRRYGKLVLTGRSPLPARENWQQWLETHDDQDDVSRKIRKVQSIEEMGAEVLVLRADVAQEEEMQGVITKTYTRFGRLHGVIHAAGIVRVGTTIREAGRTECEEQFQSKAHGLSVLGKVLQGRALDFCLLTSSLSSVLGGLGYGPYSAANLFMDAFAQKANRTTDVPWISVNWDGWLFRDETAAELAMTPKEGATSCVSNNKYRRDDFLSPQSREKKVVQHKEYRMEKRHQWHHQQ